MKFLFLSILLLSIFSVVNAQPMTHKPFRTDLSIGFALPAGTGTKGGYIFSIEPRYALNDQLMIGAKLEAAPTINGYDMGLDHDPYDFKARLVFQGTADYYLGSEKFRPFVGLGAGLLRLAGAHKAAGDSTDFDKSSLRYSSRTAITPSAGIEYGHARLSAEYSFSSGMAGYLGIKLGVSIGGGRLKD